ncbi:hypothetical protein [Sabulicella rubraurantiaca]|uniref:hypothetical protein n=1 Tax=Sabulicella rubraurantiaca TaxID=2811429 RepID=UPI001A95A75B|nr:hypothetical protein [Sabulicella rubraurantiaca]
MPTKNGLVQCYLLAAVLAGSCGMMLGIGMGIAQNFLLTPVHVHLNLLGWVTFAIYGLTYHALPEAAKLGLARVQFLLAVPGLVAFCGGLTALRLDYPVGFPLTVLGSFMTLGGMLCFGGVLLRSFARPRAASPQALPAGSVA